MSLSDIKNLTKSDKQFYDDIITAIKEQDVRDIYRGLFRSVLPDAMITSDGRTDGVVVSNYPEGYKYSEKYAKEGIKKFVALLEFKWDYNFQKSENDVTKALIQALYYLYSKDIIKEDVVPKVIFVGDEKACFCIGTKVLEKYLNDGSIDENGAASRAWSENPDLFKKLKNDKDINPYVFDVNKNFKFSEIVLKMLKLNEDVVYKTSIRRDNIDVIFNAFKRNVLKTSSLTPQEEVSLFINILLDPDEDDNYLREEHSHLVTSLKNKSKVTVDEKKHEAFFNNYRKKYTVEEQDDLVTICDRLIEDENRRREGAFFTPTLWVNEAHKMIKAELGDDWKDAYVVWDCCSGTGNLTRDCTGDERIKELYCSTLLQEELDIMEGNDINPEAEHFRYNFIGSSDRAVKKATENITKDDMRYEAVRGDGRLSKYLKIKKEGNITEEVEREETGIGVLPEGLTKALKNKRKILFLMNPPYGTAKNMKTEVDDHKEWVAESGINTMMKKEGMGAASQQLYAQFLYRILSLKKNHKLDNVVIATYSKPLFLSGPSFKKFRNKFLSEFEYKAGMLFQASHFSDVSGAWGVSFTIWKNGETKNKNEFLMDLKDIRGSQIEKIGEKVVYNVDKAGKASDWVREEIRKKPTHKDCVQLSSALNPNLYNKLSGSDIKNSIGYFHNNANNVYYNQQFVGLYSTVFSAGHGLPILPSNYKKCVALFTARKTMKGDWVNDKDEYSAPHDVTNQDYEQWSNDAIVYSLFNTSSQQSSLRNINWKGEIKDIKNEWFWMSKNEMLDLSRKHFFNDLERDIKDNNNERFIYEELQSICLSPDAQELLNRATELVKKTFEYRKEANKIGVKYKSKDKNGNEYKYETAPNLQCWDAGWYQIRIILKNEDCFKEEFEEFNKLYKAFEDRMREGVYKFRFLKE